MSGVFIYECVQMFYALLAAQAPKSQPFGKFNNMFQQPMQLRIHVRIRILKFHFKACKLGVKRLTNSNKLRNSSILVRKSASSSSERKWAPAQSIMRPRHRSKLKTCSAFSVLGWLCGNDCRICCNISGELANFLI